jgi:zinc transport system substrate-binding protein
MKAEHERTARGVLRRALWSGLGLGVVLAGLLWLGGCTAVRDPWLDVPGEPRILVTVPPVYSLARGVAGDRAAVVCLCTTKGPHDYRLNYRDARWLDRGDVFFEVGLQLDNTFSDPLPDLAHRQKGLGPLHHVNLGERLREKNLVLPMAEHDEKEHGKEEGKEHHHHGKYDPHVWMGVEQAIAIVEIIRDELVAADAEHAKEYKHNADNYIKELKKLHADGRKTFAQKKVKRIVSFHDALQYFAKSFGLEIADVIEMVPGDNPTPGRLKKLIEVCSDPKKPVGAITVEPQYPETTSARKVREELEHKGETIPLVTVDPMETADEKELEAEGKDWYVARMRRNLEALASELK